MMDSQPYVAHAIKRTSTVRYTVRGNYHLGVMTMEYTFNVTVPGTVAIGRNGSHGTIEVDWNNVPQSVKDHIAAVYFPQYITDAANSKGTNSPADERVALAQKKLNAMYAGEIRTRTASGEPTDPVENLAYSKAKKALVKMMSQVPEAKLVDKELKGDDRLLWIINERRAAREGEGSVFESIVEAVTWVLDNNEEFRKAAKKELADQAKANIDL